MDFVADLFWSFFEIVLPFLLIATPIFVIAAVICFITDGINAKKEGRKRKTGCTVAFIISMVFVALIIVGLILIAVLAASVMVGM
ncbi:MAG: hypothetical protein K6B69_03040 [Lachnospiraceae bacterium]|nr:hypothetical protein [Lachnospiraceae bacterium]